MNNDHITDICRDMLSFIVVEEWNSKFLWHFGHFFNLGNSNLFLWKNQNIRKNLPNPVFKKSDIFLYFGVIWSCESEFYGIGQFPLVGRWHFGSNWY